MSRNDCVLRVHLPYGYKVQLAVHLLNSNDSMRPSDSSEPSTETFGTEDWLLHTGRCVAAVEAEDINGHKTVCLWERHPKATLSSASNILDFQIILLQAETQGELNRPADNFDCVFRKFSLICSSLINWIGICLIGMISPINYMLIIYRFLIDGSLQ